MSFPDIFQRLRQGLELLLTWPFRWFGMALLLLLFIEPLVVLPVVGYSLKLFLTTLFSATLMPTFARADQGEAPRFRALAGFYRISLAGWLALLIASAVPFAAALGLLAWQSGRDAVDFFFSSILLVDPPSSDVFLRFKISSHLFSLPFFFLPFLVGLQGMGGLRAIRVAVSMAARHWRIPGLFFLLAFGYEWLLLRLPEFFPTAGVVLAAALLVPGFMLFQWVSIYVLGCAVLPASKK